MRYLFYLCCQCTGVVYYRCRLPEHNCCSVKPCVRCTVGLCHSHNKGFHFILLAQHGLRSCLNAGSVSLPRPPSWTSAPLNHSPPPMPPWQTSDWPSAAAAHAAASKRSYIKSPIIIQSVNAIIIHWSFRFTRQLSEFFLSMSILPWFLRGFTIASVCWWHCWVASSYLTPLPVISTSTSSLAPCLTWWISRNILLKAISKDVWQLKMKFYSRRYEKKSYLWLSLSWQRREDFYINVASYFWTQWSTSKATVSSQGSTQTRIQKNHLQASLKKLASPAVHNQHRLAGQNILYSENNPWITYKVQMRLSLDLLHKIFLWYLVLYKTRCCVFGNRLQRAIKTSLVSYSLTPGGWVCWNTRSYCSVVSSW